MSTWIVGLLLSVGTTPLIMIIMGIIAKKLPKEKTFEDTIKPLVKKAAIAVYAIAKKWLKPADISRIEEGAGKTLAYWIDKSTDLFFCTIDECIANDNKAE